LVRYIESLKRWLGALPSAIFLSKWVKTHDLPWFLLDFDPYLQDLMSKRLSQLSSRHSLPSKRPRQLS
jgi:hypothetical protein